MSTRLIPFLQLIRAPATPTTASNILMGYLLANGSWSPILPLLALLVASIAIYSAGMILNDVADADEDRALRPLRPIPSGRVSLVEARRWGWSLLFTGVAASFVAGAFAQRIKGVDDWWRAGAVTCVLAALVIAYDFGLKRTPIGPVFMGACRALNVLLGMSTASLIGANNVVAGFTTFQWTVAAGIGVFVCGISFLARREADAPNRPLILLASCVMAVGLAWLIVAIRTAAMAPEGGKQIVGTGRAAWLLALFAIPIALRLYAAIRNPIPATVQVAVATSLFSLILIDAVLCYVAGGGRLEYPIIVASLSIVSLILSRWLYAT
jgi:4-hydroxybenzoate polyprenyltransferase